MPDLSQKVGPLPAGAWAAIIGGAFLVSTFVRRKSAVPPVLAAGGLPGVNNAPPTPTTTDTTSNLLAGHPTNNEEWYRSVYLELAGHGYDPGLIDDALRNYLAGNSLSPALQLVIDRGLQLVGPVPSPLPPTGAPVAVLPPLSLPLPPAPVAIEPTPAPVPFFAPPPPMPTPIQLHEGDALPPATGNPQFYRNPDGSTFWYG